MPENWRYENLPAYRFDFPSIGNKMLKIRAILYNWKTTDRMETGFSYICLVFVRKLAKNQQILLVYIILTDLEQDSNDVWTDEAFKLCSQ